jgi:hypothetical protein
LSALLVEWLVMRRLVASGVLDADVLRGMGARFVRRAIGAGLLERLLARWAVAEDGLVASLGWRISRMGGAGMGESLPVVAGSVVRSEAAALSAAAFATAPNARAARLPAADALSTQLQLRARAMDSTRGAASGVMSGAADGVMSGAADGVMSGAADGAMSGAADGAMSGAADGAMSGAAGGAVSRAAGSAVRSAAIGATDRAVSGAAGGAMSRARNGVASGATRGAMSGAMRGATQGASASARDLEGTFALRLAGGSARAARAAPPRGGALVSVGELAPSSMSLADARESIGTTARREGSVAHVAATDRSHAWTSGSAEAAMGSRLRVTLRRTAADRKREAAAPAQIALDSTPPPATHEVHSAPVQREPLALASTPRLQRTNRETEDSATESEFSAAAAPPSARPPASRAVNPPPNIHSHANHLLEQLVTRLEIEAHHQGYYRWR